jgi:hypothetical protein
MSEYSRQFTEVMKSSGCKISRKAINDGMRRFVKENESLLAEAQRESSVLRMKGFYKKRGWEFPPKVHRYKTVCDLINGYYGKELVKHTPKDEIEKLRTDEIKE